LIRICLVDDQALVRGGLRALLGLFEGIEVVAEAEDGEAAVAAVLSSNPDVLLLDVRMPKLNGVDVLEVLAKQNRLPPTLLLTTFEDDAALVCGVRAGARGYLLKGVLPETLVEAIRVLAAGGTYLYSPPVSATARINVKGSWRDNAFDTPESLTERERDVLRLMASGIGNREIADALLLSEGTVRIIYPASSQSWV
jgi:DNA-binding NarL/FixJ family response regulator